MKIFGKNGILDICPRKLILQVSISKLRNNECECEYSNMFQLAGRFHFIFPRDNALINKISLKTQLIFQGFKK